MIITNTITITISMSITNFIFTINIPLLLRCVVLVVIVGRREGIRGAGTRPVVNRWSGPRTLEVGAQGPGLFCFLLLWLIWLSLMLLNVIVSLLLGPQIRRTHFSTEIILFQEFTF